MFSRRRDADRREKKRNERAAVNLNECVEKSCVECHWPQSTYVATKARFHSRHNDLPWNIRKFVHNKLDQVNFTHRLNYVDPWSKSKWSHTDITRLQEGMVGCQVSKQRVFVSCTCVQQIMYSIAPVVKIYFHAFYGPTFLPDRSIDRQKERTKGEEKQKLFPFALLLGLFLVHKRVTRPCCQLFSYVTFFFSQLDDAE